MQSDIDSSSLLSDMHNWSGPVRWGRGGSTHETRGQLHGVTNLNIDASEYDSMLQFHGFVVLAIIGFQLHTGNGYVHVIVPVVDKVMECSVQYRSLKDADIELTTSGKQRGDFTRADCVIIPYQFEKLKFLASSVILKGEVRDAEGVTSIYERIKMNPKYQTDHGAAAEVMNCMLEVVSMHGPQLGVFNNPESNSHTFQDTSFQWRLRLIQCSDAAVKSEKVPQFLNRMYKKYDIPLSREQVTSPIMLFEHMIDRALITPGEEGDLVAVEDIVNSCKQIMSI